jgi:hypothetical protein
LVREIVIRVWTTHSLDNRLVDGREHRIREWITWVGSLDDRGEDSIVSLLYIIRPGLWVHGRTVITIKIARGYCCGGEKDLGTGDCELRKHRVLG